MRIASSAVGALLLSALLVGTAGAQQDMAYYQQTQQPVIQQTAAAYDGYLYPTQEQTAVSPSDVPAPMAQLASPGCTTCGGFAEECSSGGDSREAWTLLGDRVGGINMGGWLSWGGYANEHSAADNGPLGFNNVGDGLTMNQLWFFAEKEVDSSGCSLDWGARADFVFGTDGPDTQASAGNNWDTEWDTSRDYGSALPQLYGELGYRDWTIKVGHFYTNVGWEVVQAPSNFFYSHAYTMYYGEPFTHTGALATYDGIEDWSFFGGWTAGWDTGFENPGDASTFLGGFTTRMNRDSTLYYTTNFGDFGDNNGGDIYMHSIVVETDLHCGWTWILQSDLGVQDTVNGGHNVWTGVNQYLQYAVSDCLDVGVRFEWFYDRDGARVLPGLAAGSFYNLTGGINYRPTANLTFRPEIRYDWFGGTFNPGGLPFDNATADDQVSIGFDVIHTF